MPRKTCKATRRDGGPCRAAAIKDGRCLGHQQDANTWRRRGSEAAREGGARRRRLAPTVRRLCDAMAACLEEKLRDPAALDQQGLLAVATLAREYMKMLEVGELEGRIRRAAEALEAGRDPVQAPPVETSGA